jgi:hypothetical protein
LAENRTFLLGIDRWLLVASFSKVCLSYPIPSGNNRSISNGFHPLSVLSVWRLMNWRVYLDFHGGTEYNVLIKAMRRRSCSWPLLF